MEGDKYIQANTTPFAKNSFRYLVFIIAGQNINKQHFFRLIFWLATHQSIMAVDHNFLISTVAPRCDQNISTHTALKPEPYCSSLFFFVSVAPFCRLSIMDRDPLPYCIQVEEYWLTKDHRMLRTLWVMKGVLQIQNCNWVMYSITWQQYYHSNFFIAFESQNMKIVVHLKS